MSMYMLVAKLKHLVQMIMIRVGQILEMEVVKIHRFVVVNFNILMELYFDKCVVEYISLYLRNIDFELIFKLIFAFFIVQNIQASENVATICVVDIRDNNPQSTAFPYELQPLEDLHNNNN